MKKLLLVLIVSLSALFSFNANAGFSAAGLTIQPWALPLVVMVAANQVEYKACNDLPYVTVKAPNGNYFFNRSVCDDNK